MIPWSPLARGLLAGTRKTPDDKTATARAASDDFAWKLYDHPADIEVMRACQAVADRLGVQPAQVAIAWLLSKPAVTAPIIGATKIEHLEAALAAVDLKLGDEEIRQLESPYQPHAVRRIRLNRKEPLRLAASVFDRVESLLNQHGVVFRVTRHEPVYTSEEAAMVRGTPLASGAKALIVKGEEGFVMFVVPADRKLDSHAVRRAKGWKKLRFATREEVLELTGLTPGSIPPFGSLFGLSTHCDERLGENEVINFNAGDHSISISMVYADYIKIEKPELGKFGD